MKNKITKKSTIRDILQILGTGLLRNQLNSNIHIASTMKDIKSEDKVIITDTRFPNELKAVKDRGGITIRVSRPVDLRFPKLWRMFTSTNPIISNTGYFFSWMVGQNEEMKKLHSILHHPSETALDNAEFDYTIVNNGGLKELVEKVKLILINEEII